MKSASVILAVSVLALFPFATTNSSDSLPIADVHVHYSHDSVELTPPERVIELMESANLKFALVSSSDDRGTQLLSDLAPDLIVPGLRPYRRRGELGTWFTDPEALAYVERLLATNRYASIGEFHLSGESADLDIPKRIVELAAEHNLILHAHSDEDAVERLLAQNPNVKVIWAHSGFDEPEAIASMLEKHDRLWADLAFRSDVGFGGSLSEDWRSLFETFPNRMMLGTDTYTPERMYFLPEHAEASRAWLSSLPAELAEKVAWKNAFDLIMPVWQKNRSKTTDSDAQAGNTINQCQQSQNEGGTVIHDAPLIVLQPNDAIEVSKPFSATVVVCGEGLSSAELTLDATMPAHGHGMNYKPEHTVLAKTDTSLQVNVEGLILHMPGNWQWAIELRNNGERIRSEKAFPVR